MSPRERRLFRRIERELSGDPTLARLATLFTGTEPEPGPAPEQDLAEHLPRPGRARLITILGVIAIALAGMVVGVVRNAPLWTDVSLAFAVCAGALLVVDRVVGGEPADAETDRTPADTPDRGTDGRRGRARVRRWARVRRGRRPRWDGDLDRRR